LAEIANRCGVCVDKVFAIGDGHNDLDMLVPKYAGMFACPGNADDDVKAHVADHGGFIANGRASVGAIEALEHFIQ